jgi:hypothetical protein
MQQSTFTRAVEINYKLEKLSSILNDIKSVNYIESIQVNLKGLPKKVYLGDNGDSDFMPLIATFRANIIQDLENKISALKLEFENLGN